MKNTFRILTLGALLFLLSGCLEMEESLSVYLTEKDGLDFVVFLDDIHSDEATEAARKKEEKKFLADFRGGRFLRTELVAAGGKSLKFEFARRRTPYAAVISGHFDKIESFWKVFEFNADRADKTARFTKDQTKRKLVFSIPPASSRSQTPVEIRQDFARRLKIILPHGRFTEARGFKLSENGRTATFDEAQYLELRRKSEAFELFLAW